MGGSEVTNLSDFVAAFSSVIRPDEIFGFRGHRDYTWKLTRPRCVIATAANVKTALGLVRE